ncbi:MAG: fatty acid desaturase [Labilithrix sp.]|nr:fatty acid desaturase [Labilithrix sp.]
MLPRNAADYRTILWALMMPVVVVAQYVNPKLIPFLCPLSFYFSMAAGTIAHNHNHCPTFKNRKANQIFAYWISVFYGYPTFAWVPTHNLNHHKHVNREGDATITWRHTNRNTWYVALSYFFVSAYHQSGPIKEYIAKAKRSNPALYREIIRQYAIWIGAMAVAVAAGIGVHGVATGVKLALLTVILPGFFGTWTMMWFNYMQHVHCDPWSEHNHSRNFDGWWMNKLLFNNGYHAAHHENPGAHWSKLPELHAKIADKIDPALIYKNFWWWIFRYYVVTAFAPSLETKQLGRAPFDPPENTDGKGPRPKMRERGPMTDSVDALDAGNNAQMA